MIFTFWKKVPEKNLIYIIIDKDLLSEKGKNLFTIAKQIFQAKPDFIQLRAKKSSSKDFFYTALKLSKMAKKYRVKLLINDRADIAQAVEADGLHLGEKDLPVKYAKKILGRKAIIGKTVHYFKEALNSLKEPVDYVSIGPIFKTSLKPHLKPLGIKEALKIYSLFKNRKITPFLIGGLNLERIRLLLRKDLNNFVLCREVLLDKNPKKKLQELKGVILN
ncbi:MAG: thiamine phosphate synthase [Candidatus Omnitrophota bacterium]|nr:MAG: thiamine phosphate synthase [Candidatus Omnitrophota bacterium]